MPHARLAAFYFFYFALLGAWLPFWPLYLKELGYGAAAIGVLTGIVQATKVGAPYLWGYVADITGQRMRVIRGGALAALAIYVGIFVRTDFYWLVLVVTGYSFFWNAVMAQFEVVTLSHLEGNYSRYSLIRVWGSIGFIAAVAGLGVFFDSFSVLCLPWVLLALLLGIVVASFTVGPKQAASARRTSAGTSRQGPARGEIARVLRIPMVRALFVSFFLLQVAHGPYYTFFSVYLEQHGYHRTQTGFLWALGVVAEVILFILMPRLFARFSLRHILLVSLLLTALRWVLVAYFVDWLAILLFAQCLHAATFASCHAVAIEYMRRFFSGTSAGQGMALYSGLCFGGGAAVGALLSGQIWEHSAVLAFVLAALAALLAFAITWRWVREETVATPGLLTI